MAAKTSSQVWSTTPLVGINLGGKSSSVSDGQRSLTRVDGSDGHVYIRVKASEALGSIDTVKIGTSGSASSDSGSAGFTLNAPGGLTTGQYGYAKKTAL